MNTFKRLIVSVKSQIDQVTEGFENHEALAEAAILEMEALRKRTCQHLFRLKQARTRQQASIDRLEEQAGRWRERAIRIRARDENKAIECVRRMKEAETRIRVHRTALEKIGRQCQQAQTDFERIEAKIASMRSRKLLLAAQQNHGQTHSLMRALEQDGADLEAVFDRWEETVAVAGCPDLEDAPAEPDLDEEFRREEEQAELQALLDELTRDQAAGRKA